MKVESGKPNPLFFANQHAFRDWLEKYHQEKTELIVGFYKVKSKKPSMTWSESVDQALCFGWIDGVRRSIDEESYSIRFTPRRRNSNWSSINIEKVEKLKNAGLMTEIGMKAYSYKKESKSKPYSYEKKPVTFSSDMEGMFKSNDKAWSFYLNQPPYYKKITTFWVMSAKKQETRVNRLKKLIQESANHKRIK